MPKQYDSTGVQMDDDFTIPDGEYELEIIATKEGHSKASGDYQVTVDFKVIGGNHADFKVRFHPVTFKDPKAKGAGIAVHFLKTIGEPWEGKFTITPDNWTGKTLTAYLAAEEYNGKKNMKVKWVKPVEGKEQATPSESMEEVPF